MFNSEEKKSKCLIAVQGPTQFLAAYIAFLWCEKLKETKSDEVTLLIYDTSVPASNENLFQDTIREISTAFKFCRIIFVSQVEMRYISKHHYTKCLSLIKSKIGESYFDYLFVARDFGSFGTKLIPNAYPSSFKVEYGDSFGLVGNEREEGSIKPDRAGNILPFLKSIVKKYIYQHFHKRFTYNLSVLSIPLLWDGNYLRNKSLLIPSLSFAKSVIYDLSARLPGLNEYCNQLIQNPKGESKVFLLSNFYNSGFSTLSNEIDLYEEIILENVSPNDKIILKNHPRGSNEVLIELKDKLIKDFKVEIIMDEKFRFVPIELWTVLNSNCHIFPIFSSSAISLTYFFSNQITLTLDSEKINKYIFPSKIAETINSEDMCFIASKRLLSWDNKSPLWIKKD